MLLLDQVSKSVPGPQPRVLLDRLNFVLPAGEFVAVTGESGVGKSTLLNLIAGLDRPDSGRILLEGVDLTTLNENDVTLLRRRRMGFVFQAFHLLPYLSVTQNVALPLRLLGHPRHDCSARAREMLERVGMASRLEDRPTTLSGGEMQRVAIARALIHQPALILADEPTGNLDPETASAIMDVFVESASAVGASVVLVTHSAVAAQRAHRILRMDQHGLVPV